ncbi:peptidoglycan DD-metalloendopeptidase family protein [Candidatus Bipolaricaulota sp. J31]
MSREILIGLLVLLVLPLAVATYLLQDTSGAGRDIGGPLGTVSGAPYTRYRVLPGDTLASISRRYGVPIEYLQASNGIADPRSLRVGQIIVLPKGGVIHTVKEGQGLHDIAESYGVDEFEIIAANDLDGLPLPGDKLLIPNPRRIPWLEALKLGWRPDATFIWPLRGRLTSLFGPRTHPIYGTPDFHTGIDFGVPEGTSVHAAAAGVVSFVGWRGGYGLLVVVDHGNGFTTYYAHLSRALVEAGQFVEQGQVIALSGNTGLSTGPHLHFEIRRYGKPVDPLPWLP